MSKSRKSLKIPRAKAFSHQHGHCYYCGHPMWNKNPDEFATRYKITSRQALNFRCTGEHLVAHQDGGTSARRNIVAACSFCNQKRHAREISLEPGQYKELVQKRVELGRWHNCRLAI